MTLIAPKKVPGHQSHNSFNSGSLQKRFKKNTYTKNFLLTQYRKGIGKTRLSSCQAPETSLRSLTWSKINSSFQLQSSEVGVKTVLPPIHMRWEMIYFTPGVHYITGGSSPPINLSLFRLTTKADKYKKIPYTGDTNSLDRCG